MHKYILTALILVLVGCNKMPKEDPAKTVINPAASQAQEETKPQGGIVEENNMCICTKEYNPVCGSNGKTYPSPCQAGCEGIKEFTEGPCKKAEN